MAGAFAQPDPHVWLSEAETVRYISGATKNLGAFDCLKKIWTAVVSFRSGELAKGVSSQVDVHFRAEPFTHCSLICYVGEIRYKTSALEFH